MQIQHKTTIEKYLWIHNIIFWKDPTNTKELTLKIKNKLAGWKTKTMSRASRLTLIKSNLTGVPNHIMTCFKCPEVLVKTNNKEGDYSYGEKNNKLSLVAWDKVCQPKSVGRLGITKRKHLNNACH